MKIEKNKVVSLSYELYVNSELADKSDSENPLLFLFGVGSMIPGFEDKLDGLSSGDSFDFLVSPEDGYGERDEEEVIALPLDNFKQNGKIDTEIISVGNVLPLMDADGNRFDALVLEVDEEENKLTVDFNHPLAGEELHFVGKVLEVRNATQEELEHGHAHGNGGHHH
ncbi:MAG: peptidylprolyl isomerase [Cytophagales bacterium]